MAEGKAAPAKKPTKQAVDKGVEELAFALAYEEKIALDAKAAWGQAKSISHDLLVKLRPLLYAHIPVAYIQHTAAVKGKPYESIGIRSVQVQIDRLNNVLGLDGWRDETEYANDGRLALVTVHILGSNGEPIVTRASFGGVDHGSTTGNIYKGSYTNAAKVAMARLGPGHEIYLGSPDLDPDVSPAIAKLHGDQGEKAAAPAKVEAASSEELANLRRLYKESGIDKDEWKMFVTSRGKREVADFDADDYREAMTYLTKHHFEEVDK